MNSRLVCPLLLLGVAACVSGAKIRAEADVLTTELERARRNGAMRCAPVELATAEAHLEFALGELSEGSSGRAGQHIREADKATKKALELSRSCAPKQVLVKDPVVVRIEETDADGDGVFDKDDACPDKAEDRDNFQDEDGCPDPDNDGDGVLDTNDKCVSAPGPQSNQGCPDGDGDGDGVADSVDKCPGQAEDKDTFQDDDGCPDPDNDGDGVLDAADKCPLEAGPVEKVGCPTKDKDGDGVTDDQDKCPDEPGPPDTQGCPRQYKMVVVKKDRIEIKQQIKFRSGSAKIVGNDSFALLTEVAQALKDNPQIKKIRVEGHTDSVGADATNLKLSQQRAEAVVAALIKERVDPARMEAVGYGEARPIASNATAEGRQENRRTEFNIVEQ